MSSIVKKRQNFQAAAHRRNVPLSLVSTATGSAIVAIANDDGPGCKVHKGSGNELRGEWRCPGINCPACAAKERTSDITLLPVIDLSRQLEAVLKLTETNNAHSLFMEIARILEEGGWENHAIEIVREGFNFEARLLERELDASVITKAKNLKKKIESGNVDLLASIQKPNVEEILEVETIRNKLEALGIDPKSFLPQPLLPGDIPLPVMPEV